MILWDLFRVFAKIGMFTFGGGYAMISMIEYHCVEQKHWIDHDEMMDITVVAESTPGPIAINAATYVGYRQAGVLGALIATLGMILPSMVVITIIAAFLDQFLEIGWVSRAFHGIKIGVGLIILDAGLTMMRKSQKNNLGFTIMVVSFLLVLVVELFAWNISTLVIMVGAALVSLAAYMQKGGKAR